MKLTKKLEAEILKLYLGYWDAYLQGDMKTFASFFDENMTVFGTAASEVFTSKKEAVEFYKATADQMTGKADFRNRKISMKPVGNTIVINEQNQLYVLIDEVWTFYGHARITAIFEQKNNLWKLVHQHGSFPDSRTEEGEQIATEKIKTENVQLREAVKRRTIELEHKNRELEIETSLEKVRAVAMSMKKADDMLNICKTISQQLAQLGVKEIRNVQTAIFYERRGTYMNYEYYAKHDKTFITEVDFKNHKIQLAFAKKMLKGPNQEMLEHLKGKKLQDWYHYQKTTNQFADKYILKAHSLNYYWYSLGPVALGISTYYPLTKDETFLFKRFLKVFELAYRRYLDIEKATAQAREAQIEAALEKVRSHSLAMHKSNELNEVVAILFEKLKELQIPATAVGLGISIEGSKDLNAFVCGENEAGLIITNYRLPFFKNRISQELYNALEKQLDFFVGKYSKKEKNSFYEYLFEHSAIKDVPDGIKRIIFDSPTYTISMVAAKNVVFNINDFEGKNLTENEIDIFKRFAKVFDQAYTRFLDLQKAEAQAREAQIEAALERVRSRTMAMHKSEELRDVIEAVYKQLVDLQLLVEHAGFILDYKEENDMHIWFASKQVTPSEIKIPYFDSPHWNSFQEAKAQGKSFFANKLNFEEKNKFYKDLFKWIPPLPDEAIKSIFSRPGLIISTVLLDNVGLYIENYSQTPFTDEENTLLKRFGKVFQQTYTRFLDLQKAEAQAREAQIELGLERVRARAMAMQHSNELSDLVDTVFKELTKLDFAISMCIINIIDESTLSNMVWGANPDTGKPPESYYMKFEDYPFHHAMLKGYQDRASKFIYVIEGEEKKIYDEYLFNETEFSKMPLEAQAASKALKKYVASFTFSNFGGLQTVASEDMSDEKMDILARFGKVFDLTYTRFNDLQKAEAQAREAQIQLALERVRARTMAMQHSDELPEAANLLFQQIQSLGMPAWSTGYCTWNDNEKNTVTLWMSSEGVLQPPFTAPTTEDELFIQMRKGQEDGKTFHVVEMGGEKLVKHYEYMRTLPVVGEILDSIIVAGHPLPTSQIMHHAYFSNGFLLFITYEPVPDAHIIFQRFGKVFDQTYTRFLDLQKAEAQAREAQIETALEKIRSRSLAMHKSDELSEVVVQVQRKFQELDISMEARVAVVVVFDKDSRNFNQWVASPDFSNIYISTPYFQNPILDDFWTAKESGVNFYSKAYSTEVKNSYFQFFFENSSYENFEGLEEQKKWLFEQEFYSYSPAFEKNSSIGIADFSGKSLNESDSEIIRRFAKVFEQAYVRFLDLQKAEAQAREAQIEAALERVRSRTIGMQQSDELLETANVVLQQLQVLGLSTQNSNFAFGVFDENEGSLKVWQTIQEGKKITHPLTFSFLKLPSLKKEFYTWKKTPINERKNLLIVHDYTGKSLEEYMAFFEGLEDFKESIQYVRESNVKRIVHHNASFSYGNISFTRIDSDPLSTGELEILKRFSQVFEQTYTRFLDLKKAEAQAREAQIEAALERVRSRTMAMQSSAELGAVAAELFAQMNQLVTNLWTCGFVLCEKNRDEDEWWLSMDGDFTRGFFLPNVGDYAHATLYEGWLKGEGVRAVQLDGDALQQHYRWLMDIPVSRAIFEEMDAAGLARPDWQKLHAAFFSKGYLVLITREPCGEEEIFKRFAQVFDQTYTRFLDLKKAEAQAREAQIEAALERIRSKSLAMFRTDDIGEVVLVLFEQMQGLSVDMGFASVSIFIFHEGSRELTQWIQLPEGVASLHIPYLDHPISSDLFDAKESGVDYFARVYSREEKNTWLLQGFELTDYKILPEDFKTSLLNAPGYAMSVALANYSGICIPSFVGQYPSPENVEILKRVSKVFEQTYTRFLDLQKAEAQAREAQIELALERVRSRSMAMHKTDELLDAAELVSKELSFLGIESMNVSYAFVDDDEKYGSYYSINPVDGKIPPFPFLFPHTETEVMQSILSSWKKQQPLNVIELNEKDTHKHQTFIGDHIQHQLAKNNIHFSVEDFLRISPKKAVLSTFNFTKGYLFNIGGERLSKVQEELMLRFTRVFEQTYTRFLDLQKAEAQAREAQIEAALERVRAVAMSMMKSDDLLTICQSVFTQLQVLGFENIRAAQIYIRNDEEEKFLNYDYAAVTGAVKVEVNYNSHPNTRRIYDVIRNAGDGLVYNVIEKEKLDEWKSYLYNTLRQQPEENLNAADGLHYYLYSFGIGAFGICTFKAINPEELDILKRFRNVFNLSYQRYADIALAEAQLREAQIETSLERVRSKTMAMHNSEDVGETVATLFDELEKLGVHTNRCGILINSEETMEAEVWTAKSNPSGKANLIIGQLDLTMHPMLQGIYHAWKSKEPVFNYTMMGDDLKSYYHEINNTKYYPTQFDMDLLPAKEFHTDFYFAEGSIFAFTSESITEEAAAIFKRFAKVFGQTYRRYLDLQKAELQTHKANIETALERVRARALAMQQPEELTEVAQVMRHEMGLLGVEELETSSIYIHEEASENAECWYAIKDSKVPEKKLVSDHFKLQLNDTWVGQQMHAFYHSNKKQISIPMKGANRKEWIDYCSKQSKLLDGFYGDVIPNRTYHLYKFSNGTIGAATPGNISAESWDLLQRAASVFSLAYSRFKDLTQARIDLLKLKEEKQRAEDALTELQATQKQLIQSEKMASLGELTAGIAHEIQNPLNFVNNFSEVSSELIKEMVEEVDKGNTEEVKAIANDVVQNLEKINHHGKRAADIVKGMLEHSRSSSGVKVPTNINALADEYLRLAYHGLRAKDKSFNATMKTDFDESIGKINIIPQDIGRVILNLITNAFYAVSAKALASADGEYQPTVSVSTKKVGNKVEIKVSDNGNGIPPKILDKIFQPFFTTKPTGQGTGLGLSLSYDIVKAHGGELKVKTKENIDAEFIIVLPINS